MKRPNLLSWNFERAARRSAGTSCAEGSESSTSSGVTRTPSCRDIRRWPAAATDLDVTGPVVAARWHGIIRLRVVARAGVNQSRRQHSPSPPRVTRTLGRPLAWRGPRPSSTRTLNDRRATESGGWSRARRAALAPSAPGLRRHRLQVGPLRPWSRGIDARNVGHRVVERIPCVFDQIKASCGPASPCRSSTGPTGRRCPRRRRARVLRPVHREPTGRRRPPRPSRA